MVIIQNINCLIFYHFHKELITLILKIKNEREGCFQGSEAALSAARLRLRLNPNLRLRLRLRLLKVMEVAEAESG